MRKYDFAKAKKIVDEHKDQISRASLGMAEDWFWTAEEVYPREFDFENTKEVAGIDGSSWASPAVKLEFKDGTERMIPCDDGGEISSNSETQRAFVEMGRGVLSGPCQEAQPKIEDE